MIFVLGVGVGMGQKRRGRRGVSGMNTSGTESALRQKR